MNKIFPNKNYKGFDLNSLLIRQGQNYIDKNLYPVSLKRKDLRHLSSTDFVSDIIISSIPLIYIPPKEIRLVLKKIKEKARVGFVLQELGSSGNIVKEASYSCDYKKLLDELGFFEDFEVSFKKINYRPWMRDKSFGL